MGPELYPCYPNPFNPTTRIEYRTSQKDVVHLEVFDLLGREVATLVNEVKGPGKHAAKFDGSGCASGEYFCRLQTGDFVRTKRVILLR